jgi:uncharacterized repeat protein (TIGR01451 family)
MSRTSQAIVAGFALLGCIVALVPAQESSRLAAPESSRLAAQESSRRTASKYKPTTAEGGERTSLAPLNPSDADLPPVVPPPTQPAGGWLPSATTSPADTAAQATPPSGTSNIEPGTLNATNSDLDDTRLRSVLKRPSAQSAAPVGTGVTPQARSASDRLGSLNMLPANAASVPAATSAVDQIQNPKSKIQNLPAHSPLAAHHSPSATSKSAALKVEIAGPPGITVGKPALFVVSVHNESDVSADEVLVRIPLPSTITVQATQPTSGDAAVQSDSRLVWSLPRVAARGKEQLKLQLITREGDNFDLSAEWTARPAVARAAIVVKQPQLALSLAGPAEMVFGEEKAFTLTVSNPGNGDAERVLITVTAANSPPQQFDAGVLPAGHKKELPLAVVASQAGAIELQISAAAEGGLEAKTAGRVTVRKAEVNVAIDGPPLKYAGSEAIYAVTVTNTGTAAAENVNLSLALPAGATYLGGIDGAAAATPTRSASEGLSGTVKWKLASLPAGSERQYEVRLQLTSPGTNRVAIQSQAAASGAATSTADTEVEAVADLKLLVQDPSGPIPTGEAVTYELQIANRGTQAAKGIKILVQFSDGIEPVSFEGCEARIVPGQVVCQPLGALGPGEQLAVRVKAKAQNAGSHHFRIEVTSADGDARLVSEGTTRFFTDSGRSGAAAATAKKPTLVPSTTGSVIR